MSQTATLIQFPQQRAGREHAAHSFVGRFQTRAASHSAFCLGIDPSDKILGEQSLAHYCAHLAEQILEEGVALVKPQSAYFERFGAKGVAVLEDMIKTLRAEGVEVLLDVKRGDIGATNEAYAQAYFGKDAPLLVDGITAHAYLGFDDLAPLFADEEKYVFIVAASSNPAGAASLHQQGAALEALIKKITSEPRAGAVIGATRTDLDEKMLAPLKDTLLLCPGIGAQGASFDDLAKFPTAKNIIPTASRAVLESADFTAALREHKDLAQKHLS